MVRTAISIRQATNEHANGIGALISWRMPTAALGQGAPPFLMTTTAAFSKTSPVTQVGTALSPCRSSGSCSASGG